MRIHKSPARKLDRSEKPRVLHVLAALTTGGIETWLMHMLRHRDMFSVDHEILLTKEEPGAYEEEVRSLGIRIHKLPIGRRKAAWLRSFRRFLEGQGPFDAVHSHVYLFSAPVLGAARAAGVQARIAHCHTARSRGSDHQTLRHRLRRAVAMQWTRRVATRRLGISAAAIEEIAGKNWRTDTTASVLIYGFDFTRYRGAAQRVESLRKRLGLEDDAPVIGHVGRFETVKNHTFLLEAFAMLLRQVPNARLVLVGEGPVREAVFARTAELGITERVLFAGTTDDVPAYMAMFDLFTLPSFSEGLGIVVVEAQAAGTPAIVSQNIPREVSVIPGAVEHMALEAGPAAWADAFARRLEEPRYDAEKALKQVEASSFGIRRCIDELDGIYRAELD